MNKNDNTQIISLAAEINRISKIHGGTIKKVNEASTLLIQTTFLNLDPATPDGAIVRAVMPPWLRIVREIHRDLSYLFEFVNDPRKFEEFIAGAYKKAGWEVILTQRSGDLGRDVIATRQDPTPKETDGRNLRLDGDTGPATGTGKTRRPKMWKFQLLGALC